MVVECDSDLAVPWMQPTDIDLNDYLNSGMAPSFGGHQRGAHVLMGDGAVQFYTDDVDPQIREAMVTASGGETFQ